MKLQTIAGKSIWLLLFFVLTSGSDVDAQTTEFTYQGKLAANSVPANGTYDFQFALFSVASGGSAIGTLSKPGVAVSGGVFSVILNFGAVFPGNDRYIEVAVTPAGQGVFTTLSPRQKITAEPYAIQSLNAVTATNTSQLGGVNASQYVLVSDSRLTDARIPLPGSNDYIQNTTAPQATANFNVAGTGTANILNAGAQFNLAGSRLLTTEGSNLYAGTGAGPSSPAAGANTFLGINAGHSITTGFSNAFVGFEAGKLNTTGNWNSFVGLYAGYSNTTGLGNNFFGSETGENNTIGNNNSFFGGSAGRYTTEGHRNSFFGEFAGTNNITGSDNTLLGRYAQVGAGNLSFGTAVGSYATVNTNDTVVIGKAAGTYDGVAHPADTIQMPGFLNVTGTVSGSQLGLATTTPHATLEVATGNILVSSPGKGIILKTPNGLQCALITINNATVLVASPVTCP